MPRGFAPLHAVLALTRWPMGVLTPVVEITALAVLHAREALALRDTVALPCIGDNDPWDVLTPVEQRAEALLRGLFIAPALHQNIEDIVVLVHRPPHVMALPIHRQKHLSQVPLVPWLGASTLQPIGVRLPTLETPLTDGLVGHVDAAFKQQFLHVAVAQGEARGEPDPVADDFARKAVMLVARGVGRRGHAWLPIHRFM
jgi:hypothetical protein